jgi:Uma2 family endonuclease
MNTITKPRGPWISTDLELFPNNGVRYEIVDGELFMSKMPPWHHQRCCGKLFRALDEWSQQTGLGEVGITPGLLFTDTDDVAPDVAWISHERLKLLMDDAGHLTGAPELVVEVLSPGAQNERRDRQAKRKLYEVQGVREYWIADWQLRQIEVYCRQEAGLRLAATLLVGDTLTSPLLPGFACPVERFFE